VKIYIENMVRISETNPAGASRFKGVARAVGLNVAVAVACAILALLYFAAAFPAGESPQPIPLSVIAFLLTTAVGIAALGFWSGWRWMGFPWLALVLTPSLLFGLGSVFGAGSSGLYLGGLASAVFLIGASAGRLLRHLRKNPRHRLLL
jgi:hypothetical protein